MATELRKSLPAAMDSLSTSRTSWQIIFLGLQLAVTIFDDSCIRRSLHVIDGGVCYCIKCHWSLVLDGRGRAGEGIESSGTSCCLAIGKNRIAKWSSVRLCLSSVSGREALERPRSIVLRPSKSVPGFEVEPTITLRANDSNSRIAFEAIDVFSRQWIFQWRPVIPVKRVR
jgi:hypothetical protein